jgi:deazaflavin-dependent oxidoreductase (nitroreductase family)
MPEPIDSKSRNQRFIAEFRSNGGHVGGPFEGVPALLLHTTGAVTGRRYVIPLVCRPLPSGDLAIFASKGGAPTNPDWLRNVLANPEVLVEFGTDQFRARARVTEGEERLAIWHAEMDDYPGFAEYEKRTQGIREIPVVVLERINDEAHE